MTHARLGLLKESRKERSLYIHLVLHVEKKQSRKSVSEAWENWRRCVGYFSWACSREMKVQPPQASG